MQPGPRPPRRRHYHAAVPAAIADVCERHARHLEAAMAARQVAMADRMLAFIWSGVAPPR